MSCSTCTDDCRQGRDCPNRKVINMDKLKGYGVVFLIGTFIGMVCQQQIFIQSIKKDCEILGMFRFGDTSFNCRTTK